MRGQAVANYPQQFRAVRPSATPTLRAHIGVGLCMRMNVCVGAKRLHFLFLSLLLWTFHMIKEIEELDLLVISVGELRTKIRIRRR